VPCADAAGIPDRDGNGDPGGHQPRDAGDIRFQTGLRIARRRADPERSAGCDVALSGSGRMSGLGVVQPWAKELSVAQFGFCRTNLVGRMVEPLCLLPVDRLHEDRAPGHPGPDLRTNDAAFLPLKLPALPEIHDPIMRGEYHVGK
jgi:hypothetical protein